MENQLIWNSGAQLMEFEWRFEFRAIVSKPIAINFWIGSNRFDNIVEH